MNHYYKIITLIFTLLFLPFILYPQNQNSNLKFSISFPGEKSKESLDGRILLMISSDESSEPRFQINDGANTQLIFGIDVEGLNPEESVVIDELVFGYPLKGISQIPAGEYWTQALINRYETFHLANGHTVKLDPESLNRILEPESVLLNFF